MVRLTHRSIAVLWLASLLGWARSDSQAPVQLQCTGNKCEPVQKAEPAPNAVEGRITVENVKWKGSFDFSLYEKMTEISFVNVDFTMHQVVSLTLPSGIQTVEVSNPTQIADLTFEPPTSAPTHRSLRDQETRESGAPRLKHMYKSFKILNLSGTFAKLPEVFYKFNLTDLELIVGNLDITGKANLTTNEMKLLKANGKVRNMTDLMSKLNLNDPNACKACLKELSTSELPGTAPPVSPPPVGSFLPDAGPMPSEETPSNDSPVAAGNDSPSSSTGLIVGIIVGALVVSLIVAVFVTRRKKSSKMTNVPTRANVCIEENHASPTSEFQLMAAKMDEQQLTVAKPVGVGNMSIGEYAGQQVMIKQMAASRSSSFKKCMRRALFLNELSHPGIVRMIGHTQTNPAEVAITVEYMEKGSLRCVLAESPEELDIVARMGMCLSIASAVKYVHSRKPSSYFQRLNSRKVLVNGSMEAKVDIFECFSVDPAVTAPPIAFGAGELAYQAPECVRHEAEIDAAKVNVYSLGVLIGEIMTGKPAYEELTKRMGSTAADLQIAMNWNSKASKNVTLPFQKQDLQSLRKELRSLVTKCLHENPRSRPTPAEIVQILERM